MRYWWWVGKMTDQYAEEKRWVFSFDLKEEWRRMSNSVIVMQKYTHACDSCKWSSCCIATEASNTAHDSTHEKGVLINHQPRQKENLTIRVLVNRWFLVFYRLKSLYAGNKISNHSDVPAVILSDWFSKQQQQNSTEYMWRGVCVCVHVYTCSRWGREQGGC